MMKYIIIVILLCFTLNVKSQTKIVKLYSPDVNEFILKSGPYLNKDIYYIDKSKLDISVVILTDFKTGNKIGYVDYSSKNLDILVSDAFLAALNSDSQYYSSNFRCYLDYDEIKYCIDCLEYAKNILSDKMPDGNRREFYYTTKLGGHIGAYIDKPLPTQYITEDITWKLFVNADPYEREKYERYVKVNRKSADKVIDEFRKAKRIIEEKTGIIEENTPNE